MVNDWTDVFSTHCRGLEVSVLTRQLRRLFALMSWYLGWAGREQWRRIMFCLSTKWETYHLWTKWPPSSPKYKTFIISFSTDGGGQCCLTHYFPLFRYVLVLKHPPLPLLPPHLYSSSSSSFFSFPSFSFLSAPSLPLLLWTPPSFLYCTDLVQAELATVSHHWQMKMYFSFCNING